MKIQKIAVIISLLLSTGASAGGIHEEGEFYLGGKAGGSIFGEPCDGNSVDCEDATEALGLYGGYQINKWLALEGGYDYLGGPTATYPAIDQPNSQVDYESTVQGFELGLKADYALTERLALFGKGGTMLWQVDNDANEPIKGSISESGSGASLMLGTGLEYRLSPSLSTRLEYQYIESVGDDSTGSSDVHVVSLGLDYRFGGASNHSTSPSPVEARASEPMTDMDEKTDMEEKPKDVMQEKVAAVLVTPVVIETFTQLLSGSNKEALFESNSTEMSAALKVQLQPVLERLQHYPETTVQLIGHTDSLGDANYNLSLSEVRAQKVADYLASQGVSRDRMTVKGVGELNPIASNETASGRAHNRRVEIVSPAVTTQSTTIEKQEQ
ncbi:outer membrane beta-barrel protein [Vibrio sp. YMD68]|uniref:outer membrane beta-barrel protein n=1 Tax=Vibrio sp. YMD68 TaxID=3042300 RepID=UPI00249B5E5D|nr:outer membrane beta-barrel protein [Vibrio sp. YMD68]WGV98268.1 outer membrane beta-barrel protein [Vibrio sp. YMD68]